MLFLYFIVDRVSIAKSGLDPFFFAFFLFWPLTPFLDPFFAAPFLLFRNPMRQQNKSFSFSDALGSI
jgi:hypothetical protein